VLARHAADHHYIDWLGDDPAYWDAIAPARLLAGSDLAVPGLHVGGWQDFLLDGTLRAYQAFRAGPAPQRLLIGPWTHAPWGRRVGSLDLGPEAATPVDAATVAFLDHVLLGREDPGPPVRLFDVGSRGWAGFSAWPEPEPTALYLASDGLAATAAGGRLAAAPGAAGEDRLVHDPWRPAPIVGGPWGTPPGYQDRAALDDRSDVAVYDGPVIAAPLHLAGRVAADVYVETAAASHDLHATLSLVEPDGRALTLTAGHLRVADAGAPGPRRIAMRGVCCTLRPGQRLRLSLQAAAWPAFAVNPGTGSRPEASAAMQAQVIVLALRHGAERPSRLRLPVLA
jgi:putative CocE/NonD family hydrolase